ncbi:hypothetical protein F5984_02360 [Rudanella paleaurantiibacter]|uniref:TonB C-terminal domain-containing protein n=1 Tax=Rudanella paleaurantiibacter TaxID=2614655 RepID=A0A7J5U540_9BACT|nr:hypothetical protein [Rudanella paleaurantiibacter]KAB7732813.1 hypothetical protein F5984_02360 [Rudanella paleaurantiibacter]
MNRILLALIIFQGRQAFAQQLCEVTQDETGRIISTCTIYNQSQVSGAVPFPSHAQRKYLGTRYLTYPTWGKGKIQIDPGSPEIPCELAFDMVSSDLLCKLNGELTANHIAPYMFEVDGMRYYRQNTLLAGQKAAHIYTNLLHTGPTQLLLSMQKVLLVESVPTNGYTKVNEFAGTFALKKNYFVQKGDARPELIALTKSALLKVLFEQADALAKFIRTETLTVDEVARVIMYYDELNAEANKTKPALNAEPVFTQFLHDNIVYPSQGWQNQLYARVYVGFDVNSAGRLKNITLLSPTNVGYGFDLAVTQGLGKYLKLKPTYAGSYVLPVAFTLTNLKDRQAAYTPINKLDESRLGNRTVLEELVVPVTIKKSVEKPREIWGYYN